MNDKRENFENSDDIIKNNSQIFSFRYSPKNSRIKLDPNMFNRVIFFDLFLFSFNSFH